LKETFDGRNGAEEGHMIADDLLLNYIGDEEVTEIFTSARKWYA
jgi:hypothetical protein